MSEVNTSIDTAADAVVDTVVEAAAPVAVAATKVAETVQKAAKRSYKPRAKKAVAAKTVAAKVAPPAVKAGRKATAAVARRKYVRKNSAAIKSVVAPRIEGMKTMTNDYSNMFAGFTALPGADKFQTMFADVGSKGQDAVRKGQALAEQMTEAAKANVEAMVESTKIATAGVRDLGQEVVASTKGSVEHASTAMKSLTEAKSPTEFFQLQSDLMKASFDRMVAEGSKFTEQMVKLAGEAVQPLSTRASISAEKFAELSA